MAGLEFGLALGMIPQSRCVGFQLQRIVQKIANGGGIAERGGKGSCVGRFVEKLGNAR